MQWHLWLTFLAAACAISVSPGAGAVASMSAGLRHGTRGSLPLVAGLALAFHAVQTIGVVYLIWLGVEQWRAPAAAWVVDGGGLTKASPANAAVAAGVLLATFRRAA